jgi:hypothetical protein
MDKTKQIKTIQEKMDKLDQMTELENLINDNKIEYEYDSESYRVRKPTFKENSRLTYLRMAKYNEMIQDENYMFEEQWAEIYKKKGINLDDMQTRLLELSKKETDVLKRLAKQTIKAEVEKLKDQVLEIRKSKNDLIVKKNNLLQFSIETQLTNYINEEMLIQVLEKKVGDNWEKVYEDYEEYENANSPEDDELILKSTYYLSLLVMRDVLQS